MGPKKQNKGKKGPSTNNGSKVEEDIDALLAQVNLEDKKNQKKVDTVKEAGNSYLDEINKLDPIDIQFAGKEYPVGEICEYLPGKDESNTLNRMTSEEKRALDNDYSEMHKNFRRAAESHRQTRKYVKSWIKPGMKMQDIWYANKNNLFYNNF